MITDVIVYWLLIVIVSASLVLLRKDSERYATCENVTKINEDDDNRVYVASRMTDTEHPGAKILLVMYSLYCRKCDSTNVFVELSEEDDSIHAECRDCGFITRIKLSKLFIKKEKNQQS